MKKILINIILIFACGTGYADTHYVSTNGASSSPYLTWANAATQIQWAVTASAANDTVLVSNGVYDTGGLPMPEFPTMTNRVAIGWGGIWGTGSVRSVNGPNVTIIKGNPDPVTSGCGDGAVRCVYILGGELSGFTLTGGYTRTAGDSREQGGGGIILRGGTVSNCVIVGNKAYRVGGGMMGYSGGTMKNCTLTANLAAGDVAYQQGGGAYFTGPPGPTMNNCTLNCNTSTYGGGAHFYDTGTMTNCTVSNNVATYGGGVYLTYNNLRVDNCLLVANRATSGGGVYFVDRLGPRMDNCLLIGNTASGNGGNAYFHGTAVDYGGNGTMNNCTLTAGIGGGAYMNNGIHGGTMTNCIVWGNAGYDISGVVTVGDVGYTCSGPAQSGTGNTGSDPLFVDTNTANYHLRANSPCVNTGTNGGWTANSVDLDGRIRIRYGIVDMGAYETIYKGTIFTGF